MAAPDQADGVTVTFVMTLKPETAEAMRQGFMSALPDTRTFPGCRSVHAYASTEDANRLILIEQWNSRQDYEAYVAWRTQSGMMEMMAGALESPSGPEYWTFLA